MTDRRVRYLSSTFYRTPLPIRDDAWISQEEIVRRIEIAREREPSPTDTRRCSRCKRVKLLVDDFHRNRGKRFGRDHICKVCKRGANAEGKRNRKRREFRAVLGRAS